MKGRGLLLAGSLLIAALYFEASGVAQANGPKCAPGTLDGLYLFTATGWGVAPGSPPPVDLPPKAIVEMIRFNGDGTLNVIGGTRSLNGTITQNLEGTGVYTVADADGACAGTLTFTPGPHFDLFFSSKGKDVSMIQSDSGNVFRGTATRVSK